MNRGMLYALGAYLAWGFLPVFWKAVHLATPLEILAHRVVWSLLFLLAVLTVLRQWRWLGRVATDRRILLTFALTSLVLSINWLTYIWAVNAGHVVESSLGYFINPLVNVVLGVVVLHERLRWGQWAAVCLAATGVIYLTISLGTLPWIALTLAFSFGIYALMRKTASLNSLEGLTLETLFMIIPAVGYLLYLEATGRGTFGHVSPTLTILLFATGVVTAVPLLLFAAGARRIPLSLVGLLQYATPTIQLMLGVFLYHEPFSVSKLVGFVLIWLALLIYSGEGLWQRRQVNALKPVAAR